MNKLCAFISFCFFISIAAQEKPERPMPNGMGSSRSGQTSLFDLERESLAAVTYSTDLEKIPKEYCDQVISNLPGDVKERVERLIDPRRRARTRALPDCMIFYGPTGSGKSTLAHVVLQQMDMPFMVVKGSQLESEYANSGKSSLRRIGNIAARAKANLVVDEVDKLARKKSKKSENQAEDETPSALWEMLDVLIKNKLLFIGTSNEITGMPVPLQSRIKGSIFEIPYLKNPDAINSIILTCLQGEQVDSQKTIQKLITHVKGRSNRDINKLVVLALGWAGDRNVDTPVITLADFMKALNELKKDEKLTEKTEWDKKEVFTYTVQTIGAIANIVGIINTIFSIKNGLESLRLAREGIRLSKESAAKVDLRAVESQVLQRESIQLSKDVSAQSIAVQKEIAANADARSVESLKVAKEGLLVNKESAEKSNLRALESQALQRESLQSSKDIAAKADTRSLESLTVAKEGLVVSKESAENSNLRALESQSLQRESMGLSKDTAVQADGRSEESRNIQLLNLGVALLPYLPKVLALLGWL